MASGRASGHTLRSLGLWALGGVAGYLIIREFRAGAPGRAAGHTSGGPVTPATLPADTERGVEESGGDSDQQLDAAVDATFPASDPISMQFE